MVKVFKEFVEQADGRVLLMLHTKDNPTPKPVEGIDFAGVPTKTRELFLEREGRQIDTYFVKNKTGNFSMNMVSKHDPGYGQKVQEDIKFWKLKGIVLL